MSKDLKKIIISGIFLLMLISGIIIEKYNNQEAVDNFNVEANSPIEISNKKIEWGIQRKNNHEQPDLGTRNKELIDKYNGIAIGAPDKKYIYLTFDMGYEAGYTEKILDTLKENNVQGIFFLTAHYINTAPDLVKRMIDEGHIVGNQFPTLLMDI